LKDIEFGLFINGVQVQWGNTKDMIFDFSDLLVYTSRFFKLHMGDLIFTGTPAGVGPVKIGDHLEAFIGEKKLLDCHVR